MSMAWHDTAPYSRLVASKVAGGLQASDSWRRGRIGDIAAMAWTYEREKHALRERGAGVTAGIPGSVVGRFPWLEETGIPGVNLVKSAVDTVVAWLFSDPPPLVVGSSGADFEAMRQVEARSLALDSTMNRAAAKKQIRMAARDAALKGFGAIWPRVRDGHVEYERLHFYQLYWDPFDARSGHPSTLHIVEQRDRKSFLGWYRSLRDIQEHDKRIREIEKISRHASGFGAGGEYVGPYDWELAQSTMDESTDLITVVHSYRVASQPGADDGRYVCTVYRGSSSPAMTPRADENSVVAIDGVFPRTTLPVCMWSMFPSDEGIDGVGIGHMMSAWQEALDRGFLKIQRALDKYGHIKIIVPEGSVQNIEAFAQAGVTVLHGPPGDQPQIIDPQVIRKEDLMWIDRIMSMSMSPMGINQMMSQGGSRLSGQVSSLALIEESYRALDRLSDVHACYEEWRLAIGRETLNAIEDALAIDKKFRAQYEDKDGILIRRPWSELVLPNGEYDISIQNTGALGGSRSGQVAKILDLAQRNTIDQDLAKEALLTTPDVRRLARLETAGYSLIERQLNELIDPNGDHEYAQPDKDLPLPLALSLASKYILLARARMAKPETVQRLREYKRAVEALIAETTAQPEPTGALPGEPDMQSLLSAAQAAGLSR